jgi:polysaccharide biosynthesis/export protein
MKRKMIAAVVLLTALAFLSPLHAADPAEAPGDYIIGPGDVLQISVWNNEALTRPVTVLPDGKIHFPLIGEMAAGGKTVGALKGEMEKKITTFVEDPNLSVMVAQVNSLLIYVIGKVNQPGRFPLNTNVNVLQALSMAGGLNAFAKKDKIRVFREIEGKTRILSFEYDNVAEGRNLEQNIRLERGDVVVVP